MTFDMFDMYDISPRDTISYISYKPYKNRNGGMFLKTNSVRNEIKAQIVRTGCTMQDLVARLSQEYGWSGSISNLSSKLQRESIRYKEVVEIADVLGYKLVWQKKGANDR